MVDLGLTFPTTRASPASTSCCPNRASSRGSGKPRRYVLTHAHEDHIGAVIELWPPLEGVPIYATPFTAGMLEAGGRRVWGAARLALTIVRRATASTSGRSASNSRLSHSIPESNALAIRTPPVSSSIPAIGNSTDTRCRPPPTRRGSRRSATRASWRSSAIRQTPCAKAARLRSRCRQALPDHCGRQRASPSPSSPRTSRASAPSRMPRAPPAAKSSWPAAPCIA